jgi:hypothetical protein
MTRGRIVLVVVAILVLAAAIAAGVTLSRLREGRRTTAELQAHIAELTTAARCRPFAPLRSCA